MLGPRDELRFDIPEGRFYFKFSNGVILTGGCNYFDNAEDIKKECLKEAKDKYGNDIYIVSSRITTLN